MTRGTLVRFTDGPLGTLSDETRPGRFEPEVVNPGDEGTYHGEHPHIDGWHIVDVVVNDRSLFVPCDARQFEVAV